YFPLQLNILNIVSPSKDVSHTLSGMVLAYWERLQGNHLNDLNQLYPPVHKHYQSKFLHSYRLLFSFPELSTSHCHSVLHSKSQAFSRSEEHTSELQSRFDLV